jgi:DNA processing protein
MTMMWNVPVADIDRAIAPLRPESTAEDRLAAFADAAWSFLVEPGDRVAGALVRRFGSSEALARIVARPTASTLADDDLSPADVAEALARWEPRLETPALFRALTSAATLGITLVRDSDNAWPDGLVDLGDNGPRVLWVRGQVEALPLTSTSVAIVGARASTGYGEHVAMDFAAGFVSRGYSVVSGGAYGIDGMAHRATLACGGTTIAVMAGGLDNLYPSGHEELLKRIMNTGAVVSEVSPGGAPTRWRFLQRNRLIAAMAGGTVVIEAGYRSGSLNTATHARDLDRPLGVVPGPITSGQSAGCHRMLRTNPAAHLVTSVADVIELITGSLADDEFASRDADDTVRVLDALSNSPRTAKSIAKRSGLAEADVSSQLRLLDAEGRISSSGNGWRRV